MADTFTSGRATDWLSAQLEEAADTLAARWISALVDLPAISTAALFDTRHTLSQLRNLLTYIAEHLRRPDGVEMATNREALTCAAELGELRFAQRASVHQLLRDYQMLEELIEEFFDERVRESAPPLPAPDVLRVTRRLTHAIRTLQQQTIDTFISRFTATIERQNTQLLSFGRTVAHEIRQPLSVLQVTTHVMPVRPGDVETTRLIDVMDRNIARLAEVAARLERAAMYELETDLKPNELTVNLTALVDVVAARLSDAARSRGVRVSVDAALPTLHVDQSRMELVFLNLIANAIKHADPAKPSRFVRIEAVPDAPVPTVLVLDNGVGISPKRVQHLFRELGRAHGYRDEGLADEGLGLGLSIVRECMDASGGTVRLDSAEGHGTTVTLTWGR